jgi:hypothetical protein
MRVTLWRQVYTVSKASRLTLGGYDAAQEQAETACLLVSKASRLAFGGYDTAQEQAGTAGLLVSKASRLAFGGCEAQEQAGTAGLLVSKASRLTFFFVSAVKLGCSLDHDKAGCPAERRESTRDAFFAWKAKRDAWLTSMVMGFFAGLVSLLPALAGPISGTSIVIPPGAPAPNAYVTVKHLGESDQQAAAREGQLLSHRRATDPFGNSIRGPFKGLPPVVEHSTPIPGPPTATTQAAVPANVPTLEKAVLELTIGAVNVGTHELLIGSRSIHEGDLLVLESEGHQFVVWVQSVGVHGVLFCDIDMQKHILKPFGSGPRELPSHAESGMSDIRNFLTKDASP